MKNIIFLLLIFMIKGITLNAQNFDIIKNEGSDILSITPTFDTLRLENKKKKLVYFDSNYMNDFINKTITESFTQTQINKLKETLLVINVYVGNDGKIFYAYFIMREDLHKIITDSDLRIIYDKFKEFTFDMNKATEDPRYPGDFTSFMITIRPD